MQPIQERKVRQTVGWIKARRGFHASSTCREMAAYAYVFRVRGVVWCQVGFFDPNDCRNGVVAVCFRALVS